MHEPLIRLMAAIAFLPLANYSEQQWSVELSDFSHWSVQTGTTKYATTSTVTLQLR